MDVFSASVEMIVWFLTFIVLTGFIRSIDLGMSSPSCMPGIAPAWSWTCGWVQFAGIYWAFSHLCSLGYWPVVLLFLYCPLLASVLGYSWPYKISLGVFPPLWFLEQVLKRIGMNLWNVWLHSPAKPSGPSLAERFLTRSGSWLVIALLGLSSWSGVGRSFLNFLLLSGCPGVGRVALHWRRLVTPFARRRL